MRELIRATPEPTIIPATQVTADAANFDGALLTASEDTAQKCLDKIAANLSSVVPQNGFVNRTDSSISAINSTRTFSIQPTSPSFTFYSGATRYTKTTQNSVVFPDTDGMHHFYFDPTGTLVTTQTFSDAIITTYAYVASVYWDATNKQVIFTAEERHGCEMDSTTHLYLHSSAGTQFGTPLGFGLISVVADGNGSLETHARIGVNGGTIWDEDLKHTIATLSAPASIPCFYLTGAGVWRRQTATQYPLIYTTGGLANWNRFQTGTWSLVQCTSGDLVLCHLFATNDPAQPIISIAGQAVYSTIANARAGAKTELNSLVLVGFPSQEFVPIATLIWETRSSYTNTPKSRIRTTDSGASYIDWRSNNTASGGTAGVVTSWGNIVGTLTSQADLNTALSNKISTTNLKDTTELVYDSTNRTLIISASGTGTGVERLRLVNSDTSTGSAALLRLFSGASSNSLVLTQFGTEYTAVPSLAGKSRVSSSIGGLVISSAADIEFQSGGTTTRMTLKASGNLLVNSATDDATNKLQVTGGISIPTSGALNFGGRMGQLINLFTTGYGIGIQSGTVYFRAIPSGTFSWHLGGVHSDAANSPGSGGTETMRLSSTGLSLFAGSITVGSTQVVGTRKTGWTAMTGTATRTAIPSDTPTNQELGRCLKALIDDLITHGLIGA